MASASKWSSVFSVLVVLSVCVTAGAFAQEIKNPDTLVVAHIGEPESLDPAWMYDTSSAAVAYNVYEGLVAFDRQKADAVSYTHLTLPTILRV